MNSQALSDYGLANHCGYLFRQSSFNASARGRTQSFHLGGHATMALIEPCRYLVLGDGVEPPEPFLTADLQSAPLPLRCYPSIILCLSKLNSLISSLFRGCLIYSSSPETLGYSRMAVVKGITSAFLADSRPSAVSGSRSLSSTM